MATAGTADRLSGIDQPGVVAAQPTADAIAAVAQMFETADSREKFIPVTRQALIDRLSQAQAWPHEPIAGVRRLFSYLNQWRQQSYGAKLIELEQAYEPFSPDSDLLVTRRFSSRDRSVLEARLMAGMCDLLQHANYTRIDASMVDVILTRDSAYGLDLHVDLNAFAQLEIWYRGVSKRTATRRSIRNFYLQKEDFDIPIFRRLAIVFKLKSEEQRIAEVMAGEGIDAARAERKVKRMRGLISDLIKPDYVYVKLFKNIPRADLEMVFPNTKIRFRLLDKIRLGVTAGGGLGMGVFGTVSKIAVASNPIALAGAVVGLGGVALRQVVNFTNQRNKYMVTMAQNLYSHAMADNRGAMTFLAERAAEEDFKEEVLLYSLLAKETVRVDELRLVDEAIERYLSSTFGVDVNFDMEEAFERLQRDGLVSVKPDGTLVTLRPEAAAARIDALWDRFLDDMPAVEAGEGYEYEAERIAAGEPS